MSEYITGTNLNHNLQNTSSSKQMYSFGKDPRFHYKIEDKGGAFYNIPSSLSTRSTSFGYGNKYDITTLEKERLKIKTPYYDLSRTKLSSYYEPPRYTFGESRDKVTKIVIDGDGGAPASTRINSVSPGPANYNVARSFGNNDAPKYSFRTKIYYKGKGYVLLSPGPGSYSNIQINKEGKYPISQYQNISRVPWGMSKSKREVTRINNVPGPGKYSIDGLMNGKGKVYNSKYKSSTARSMGQKLKGIFDKSSESTPGPGSYSTFSEFGYYKMLDSGVRMNTQYGSFKRPKLTGPISLNSTRTNFKK